MAKKKKETLQDMILELLRFLGAKATTLPTWTAEAFRSLIKTAVRLSIYSTLFFLISVSISAYTGYQNFLFWVAIPYLFVIALVLLGRQSLQAAGLLIAFDAVEDMLIKGKGMRVEAYDEKEGRRVEFELDFPTVAALRSLNVAGQVVFYLVLQHLINLAVFGFIPIWEHPSLMGPLFLIGLIWIMLELPWAKKNAVFGQLRPLAMFAWMLTVGVLVINHIFLVAEGYLEAANWQAHQLESAPKANWLVIVTVAVAALLVLNFPEKKEEKK